MQKSSPNELEECTDPFRHAHVSSSNRGSLYSARGVQTFTPEALEECRGPPVPRLRNAEVHPNTLEECTGSLPTHAVFPRLRNAECAWGMRFNPKQAVSLQVEPSFRFTNADNAGEYERFALWGPHLRTASAGMQKSLQKRACFGTIRGPVCSSWGVWVSTFHF